MKNKDLEIESLSKEAKKLAKKQAKKLAKKLAKKQAKKEAGYIKLKGSDIPKIEQTDGWKVTDKGIYKKAILNGISVWKIIAKRPVIITGRTADANSKNVSIFLEWRVDDEESCKDWRSALLTSKDVQTSKFIDLNRDGIPVFEKNRKILSSFLADSFYAKGVPEAKSVDKCGWINIEGESTGFMLGTRYITANKIVDATKSKPSEWGGDTMFMRIDDTDGSSDIIRSYQSGGKADDWRDMFKTVGNTPNVLMGVYLSMASPIISMLKLNINPVVEYNGRAQCGKSTTLKLVASVWGDSNSVSLIPSWNSTPTARERFWRINNYLPSCMDETKTLNEEGRKEAISAIYKYANKTGKSRANLTGLDKTISYNGVLFSTGEEPMVSFEKAEGAHTRVLNLSGSPFGPDRQEKIASGINNTLKHSFGHYGPKIIQWILRDKTRLNLLKKRFNETDAKYLALSEGRLTDRQTSMIALIDLGMYLAQMVGLPAPKCDPLDEAFKTLLASKLESDLSANALSDVFAECVSNECKFDGRSFGNNSSTLIGVWDKTDDWSQISIIPSVLDKWFTKLGYNNYAMLNQWKDRGWLVTNPGRKTRRTRMNGSLPRLVCIKRSAIDEVNKD